jgi:hypothetical protein
VARRRAQFLGLVVFACVPASITCDQLGFDGGQPDPPFDCFGTPCHLEPSFADNTCCIGGDGGGTCQHSKDSPACNVAHCGPQIQVDPDGGDLASDDAGPCIAAPYTFSCSSNATCKNGNVCCMSYIAFAVNVACGPGPCFGDDYAVCDTVADCPDAGLRGKPRCVPIALRGKMMPFRVCVFDAPNGDAAVDSALE